MPARRALLLLAAAAGAQACPALAAEPEAACAGGAPADACAAPSGDASTAGASAVATGPASLVVFWGVGCPRCEEARPLVERLSSEHGVPVEWVEIRRDAAGRARFAAEVERLGIRAAGIPLFVSGDRAVVGFRGGAAEGELRALLGTSPRPEVLVLPLVGAVDPSRLPLVAFTAAVGLLDGFNPCAMYVLVALLGLLLHVPSRRRVALYGGTFVAMSGAVYFLFMTAWLGAFAMGGLSRAVTVALGAALVGMGLLDLKDAVWLRRGPSLSIPARAKPGLFRRMRGVASSASAPAALAGIAALAFVVNLVELGCTLGLPAMYTRVLSMQRELPTSARLAYVGLYCLFYVVPLAAIVAAFALTLRRLVLSERRARVLKGVAGALLVAFGTAFLWRPGLAG
jgi:thiol-disulfide isomerase/thioredoxin